MKAQRNLLFALTGILLLGCNSGNQAPSSEQALPATEADKQTNSSSVLSSSAWELVALGLEQNEKQHVLTGSQYTLEFKESNQVGAGELTGKINCNQLFSSYQVEENRLLLKTAGITEMGCITMNYPEYNQQENFITQALYSTQSYQIKDTQLIITASDSSQLIFNPFFQGCADPAPVSEKDYTQQSYTIRLRPNSNPEGFIEYASTLYNDLSILSQNNEQNQITANSSDQTLRKLQCEPDIISIQHSNSATED